MEKKEVELRISDLAAALLKRVKPILCITLAAILLAGGFGAYKAKNSKASQASDKQIEIAEMLREGKRKKVAHYEQYIENSVYYNMDYLHRGECCLTIYIDSGFKVDPEIATIVTDPQASIVSAYTRIFLHDSDLIEEIKKMMDLEIEDEYLFELIDVAGITERIVRITVLNDNLEAAEKAAYYLYESLYSRTSEQVADHDANIIAAFTGYELDEDMYTKQTTVNSDYKTTRSEYISANSDLKALKNTRIQASAAATLKSAAKYAAVGLIGGLVAACLLFLLVAAFSGKVQNQYEVQSRYPFPVIGVLPRSRKVWFDRWIRKLEGEPIGEPETLAQATAQSLAACAGERKIGLVSTVGSAVPEKLVKDTDEKVQWCGDLLREAEAVKALAGVDGVVLVETRGKTRKDLMDSEVLRAKMLGKEIVGVILA